MELQEELELYPLARQRWLPLFAAGCLLVAGSFGCTIEKPKGGSEAEVDTPLGTVAATEGSAESETIPLDAYPNARRTQGDPDGDGGVVSMSIGPFFSMKIIAFRYESEDPVDRVAAFYRQQLGKLGEVKEISGGPDTRIHNFRWKPGPDQRMVQVHKSGRTYAVALKPKNNGCTFAVLYFEHGAEPKAL